MFGVILAECAFSVALTCWLFALARRGRISHFRALIAVLMGTTAIGIATAVIVGVMPQPDGNLLPVVASPIAIGLSLAARKWLSGGGFARTWSRGVSSGFWGPQEEFGGLAAPRLWYRTAELGPKTIGVWHVPPGVESHSDIVLSFDDRRYFVRRYKRWNQPRAARTLAPDAIVPAVSVKVMDGVGEYLAEVLDAAPRPFAALVAAAGIDVSSCMALLPEGREETAVDFVRPWAFPQVTTTDKRVHAPARKRAWWEVLALPDNTESYYWRTFIALLFEPRVRELGALLCSTYGDEAALVFPDKGEPDTGLQGGPVRVCPLAEPETVGEAVLSSMVPVPFIGLVVRRSSAEPLAGAPDVSVLERDASAVLACVVGIFDGESFAVFSRV